MLPPAGGGEKHTPYSAERTIAMTRAEIEAVLPHREPFLFIDEITELVEGERVTALKKLTGDEVFFKGHFPGYPIFPGVLMIEAIAQAGAVIMLTKPENKGKIGLLAGVDSARIRRKVFPGDTMVISVGIEKFRMGIGVGAGKITVNGALAATASLKFAIGDK